LPNYSSTNTTSCEDQEPLLNDLNQRIIHCRLCPRLIEHAIQIGQTKTKRFTDQDYWSQPVPSYGDPKAKLFVIGLAPAANGGNRTGRIFTGDGSGDWLVKALHMTGFANKPTSTSRDDGLILNDSYLTAVARCVPPQNKPTSLEISNCSQYLITELKVMDRTTKVILTLGKIAFDAYCNINNIKGLKFGHNRIYPLSNKKTLIASYHPSRRNTNTGTLTWQMWINIFETARSIIDEYQKENKNSQE